MKAYALSFVKTIINTVVVYIEHLGDLAKIARLETQLAVRSLLMIALLAIISGALLFSTWLCLLVLLFIYLAQVLHGLLLASLILVLLNIFLVFLILLLILKQKKNLRFSATRRQLARRS